MNRREKMLIGTVASLILLIGGGLGVRSFISKPLKDMDRKISTARERMGKIQTERRNCFSAEDKMKEYNLLSFADTVDEASARSGELLTKQIIQAGLKEAQFTRLPVGPRKLRGASEIGWNVQGDGHLAQVVNLLFLLQNEPHLQRVENVTLSTGDAPGVVRVRFRTLTLVMEAGPEVERKPLQPKIALNSPQRSILDMIVDRDIMRPYVKRKPIPKSDLGNGGGSEGGAKPPGPESLRIVSLSEWQGQPEIHVRDTIREKTIVYKPGDSLGGGIVEMVDYRPMRRPGSIGLQSYSRVIVRRGDEFWAAERGQTLADFRRLESEQLPPGLMARVVPTKNNEP